MIDSVGTTGPGRPALLLSRGGVFAHLVGAGVGPEGGVHYAVHDRVDMNSGARVLVLVLSWEYWVQKTVEPVS